MPDGGNDDGYDGTKPDSKNRDFASPPPGEAAEPRLAGHGLSPLPEHSPALARDTGKDRFHTGSLSRSATLPIRDRQPPHHTAEDAPRNRRRGRTFTSQIRGLDGASPAPRSPLRHLPPRVSERQPTPAAADAHHDRQSMTSERTRFSANGMRRRTGTVSSNRHLHQTVSGRAPSLAYATGRVSTNPEPSYSLAGPSVAETLPANQPFVQPGYADLNPAYDQPVNARPVWGLAKPLPRVIRPGMMPSASEIQHDVTRTAQETKQTDALPVQDPELGHVESHLRLGKISSQLQEARERREQRLLQRIASHVSAARVASHDAHAILTPPNESSEDDEQKLESNDVGLSRLDALQTVSERLTAVPSIDAGLTAWPDYDDGPSTVHDDLAYQQEWTDNELLQITHHDPDDEIHNNHTHWSLIRTRFREPLAELLAVYVQLTLGFCADLVVTCSRNAAGNEETTDWAWGLAATIAIYIAGGISGAHLNPAISLMLYVYRGFPLRQVGMYIPAQILGAFFAALTAYGLYRADIVAYGGSNLANSGTLSAFITFPRHTYVNLAQAFFNEFVGTAILVIAVLALGDDMNSPPGAGMSAFIIGLLVTVLSMAFGYNTGAALNPSRDFGPRLALLAVGYGPELFTNAYWFVGPWCGTISGALVGAAIYDVMIFTGGESIVNYPRRRIKRAGHKWKVRTGERVQRVKVWTSRRRPRRQRQQQGEEREKS